MNPINKHEENNSEDQPTPPGAPDRTPVDDPGENKPMGDPQSPEKKKPRL